MLFFRTELTHSQPIFTHTRSEATPDGEEGGVLQFTRYVAHTAPSSLLQIRMTFRELDGGDDDMDEDEDYGEDEDAEEDE